MPHKTLKLTEEITKLSLFSFRFFFWGGGRNVVCENKIGFGFCGVLAIPPHNFCGWGNNIESQKVHFERSQLFPKRNFFLPRIF